MLKYSFKRKKIDKADVLKCPDRKFNLNINIVVIYITGLVKKSKMKNKTKQATHKLNRKQCLILVVKKTNKESKVYMVLCRKQNN